MRAKLNSIVILRVIAMIIIIFCHYFEYAPGFTKAYRDFGFFLGGLGNMMFFTISSLLYGIKWFNNDFNSFNARSFLISRIIKLFVPLWLYLLVIYVITIDTNHPMTFSTLIYNSLGLSWFRPYTYAGHLWFITMLIIMYCSLMVLSYTRFNSLKIRFWILTCLSLGGLLLGFNNFFDSVSKVIPLIIILSSAFVFCKAHDILVWCTYKRSKSLFLIAGILCLLVGYLYVKGCNELYFAFMTFLASVTGFIIILAFLSIRQCLENKSIIVDFLSSISYEVYLVHLPISVLIYKCCYNQLYLLLLVMSSILVGYILKYASEKCIGLIVRYK